jgi:hypothetical protein
MVGHFCVSVVKDGKFPSFCKNNDANCVFNYAKFSFNAYVDVSNFAKRKSAPESILKFIKKQTPEA